MAATTTTLKPNTMPEEQQVHEGMCAQPRIQAPGMDACWALGQVGLSLQGSGIRCCIKGACRCVHACLCAGLLMYMCVHVCAWSLLFLKRVCVCVCVCDCM